MAPRDLAIGGVEAVLLHELGQTHRPVAGHVSRAGAKPVELDAAALHRLELILKRLVNRLWTRAEDADIGEDARIVIGRSNRMAAAHRESRDRAVVLGRQHAKPLLDEWNHVLHETLRVRTGVGLR